jgi:DNA-directed RNA polymerase subunit RPC12/RpoP
VAERPLFCLACTRAWRVIFSMPLMATVCPYCGSRQIKEVGS